MGRDCKLNINFGGRNFLRSCSVFHFAIQQKFPMCKSRDQSVDATFCSASMPNVSSGVWGFDRDDFKIIVNFKERRRSGVPVA